MKMTPDEIRQGYFEKHGREMQEKDYYAFLRMCEDYGGEDCETYSDALEKIKDYIRRRLAACLAGTGQGWIH